jgi:hypothetical protein
MKIDERAPAIARGGIEIDAHAQVVWDVLTDIDKWPSWNPDVKRASVDGGPPLHRGSVFRWKAGPGTITSTVQEIEPPRRVGWTGKTIGIDAVHVWRLEGHDGHTRVQTKESWNGPLPRLLRGPMRKTLQRSIDSALRHLKAEAERRAMGGPGPSDLDAWERPDK